MISAPILDAAGNVQNDETLLYLQKIACSYAKAGVDMVAPSDMIDGHVEALRFALDEAGYEKQTIHDIQFLHPFDDIVQSIHRVMIHARQRSNLFFYIGSFHYKNRKSSDHGIQCEICFITISAPALFIAVMLSMMISLCMIP